MSSQKLKETILEYNYHSPFFGEKNSKNWPEKKLLVLYQIFHENCQISNFFEIIESNNSLIFEFSSKNKNQNLWFFENSKNCLTWVWTSFGCLGGC